MGCLSSDVIMHWLFHRADAIRSATQQYGHESLHDGLLCCALWSVMSCHAVRSLLSDFSVVFVCTSSLGGSSINNSITLCRLSVHPKVYCINPSCTCDCASFQQSTAVYAKFAATGLPPKQRECLYTHLHTRLSTYKRNWCAWSITVRMHAQCIQLSQTQIPFWGSFWGLTSLIDDDVLRPRMLFALGNS